MAHTYTSILIHYVFSTKGRRNTIERELQPKIWSYLGGIARRNGVKALVVGGTQDHVHTLISIPATMPVAKAAQLLKGGSSKWIRETLKPDFEWQSGYGAFSLGVSQVDGTTAYIASQAEHHKRVDYREEFLAFLKKHNIAYDPRYIWD